MLRIHRYTTQQTGKTTIQAHVFKNNVLVKSYNPCDESFINVLVKGHRLVEIVNVAQYRDLKINRFEREKD